MNKIVLLFFILSMQSIFAQKLSKEELKDVLTKNTCECVSSKDLTPENFELPLGLCIFEAINKNREDVIKHYGKDYFDKMEQIGEDIGGKMMDECPESLKFLFNDEVYDKIAGDEDSIDNETDNTENYDDQTTIKADFVSVKEDGFLYVNFKEKSGKTHQMILINNFESSYLITDGVLKANDSVEIYYFDAELYDVKYKKFINCKVIDDIIKL